MSKKDRKLLLKMINGYVDISNILILMSLKQNINNSEQLIAFGASILDIRNKVFESAKGFEKEIHKAIEEEELQ